MLGGIVEETLGNGPSHRIFFGSWKGSPKNRYLGGRVSSNGQTHYVWGLNECYRLVTTTDPQVVVDSHGGSLFISY